MGGIEYARAVRKPTVYFPFQILGREVLVLGNRVQTWKVVEGLLTKQCEQEPRTVIYLRFNRVVSGIRT